MGNKFEIRSALAHQEAQLSLNEPITEKSDLQPLVDYIAIKLEAYDVWRDWSHPFPHIKRAHHLNSDRDLVDMALLNQLMIDNESFWKYGVPPSRFGFHTVSHFVVKYLQQLRTQGSFVHHINEETGEKIVYDVDVAGQTVYETLRYAEGESQVFWRTLRSPGSTHMCLTAFPDRRCEACTHGLHCRHHTLKIPDDYEPQTEATKFFRGFHLRDANILANYYRKYSQEVDIAEYYPAELVFRWVEDQNLEAQATKHGIHTFYYHGQYIVPVALKTTLYNYRKNLWDQQVIPVAAHHAHYIK